MLNIVVAWMAEARPLVDHFRLEPLSKRYGFRIYRGAEIHLVISGQGSAAAAAGCAWLQSVSRSVSTVPWLNIGIAGHRDLAIGSAVLARAVIDEASGRQWRLPLAAGDPAAAEVLTVATPDTRYRHHQVVEMEASGFVETALRFTDRCNVACLKVISDNAASPAGGFEPAAATRLIAARLDAVEELIGRLEHHND